jgi:hypothetical protein
MKSVLLAIALTFATAASASAAGCGEDLKKLDTALQAPDISPDVKAEVLDMRNQAEKLCTAGNEEEGEDVLAEAAALLGIE